MRLLIWISLLLPNLFTQVIGAERTPKSIAFYYNSIDSVCELMIYDRVVVTPNVISQQQIASLHQAGTQVFAYLSIGEYDGKTLPQSLTEVSPVQNVSWQSHVMDLSAVEWQEHIAALAAEYLRQGFDGLFLDTLDSYQLFAKQAADKTKQQQALVQIIQDLAALKPTPTLILNRGFEVLELLSGVVHAVAAESLYHAYSPLNDHYRKVNAQDQAWLSQQLNRVKALGLEVIVIDYIPESDQGAQQAAAQRLLNEGYTPYISDGLLYQFGVSTMKPLAKRLPEFFDGRPDAYP
ncbi:endo alpha-1,4 polygalactosaminidase [Oceanisphaera sp. W20_SRM_FM3]|uniref:endo alpha-1,4 polygalactosaminidase n=1 Tax=Oceanisphaera sp. W20_SRM_FM3 TaxID=3240267 RepID=UPI003F9AA29E